jgi:hypothetical protein
MTPKLFIVFGENAKSFLSLTENTPKAFLSHMEKMREKIKLKYNKYKRCPRNFSFGDTPVGDEITLHRLFRVTVGEVPV